MRSFRKNVLRLALQNRASVLGSVLIIAIGIFVMVSMFDTLQNLTDQIYGYYERYQMADVFVTVRGIPLETVQRMDSIEGIAKADGKLSADVRMICEGQTEIATVHLMGYREDARVNQMDLFGKTMTEETVFIGSRMAEAYGFAEGDPVNLIIGGESYAFTYAGSVGAPDYVYAVSTESAMVPDGSSITVEGDVLTSIAPYVKPGDPAEISLDLRGGKLVCSGKVSQVYDYAVEDVSPLGLKEYKVHVVVTPDDPSQLSSMSGYEADLKLQLFRGDDVLTVPSEAVFESGGAYYVFTVADGKAVKTAVEAGYRSPLKTVILSGLSEGDEIVARAESEGVYDGAAVRWK